MKFARVNGEIKFITHVVTADDHERKFWDDERFTAYTDMLGRQGKEYTVTECDTPTPELLGSVEGRKFKTYADAKAFIDGTYEEPLTVEMLAEVMADLIGGAL